ncbi:MAG TPA: hypothetical protein VKE51_17560 [Vicinamibacterales bacterium]|nr:hypothetical protein [Vicinamibacterales bacterium]
MASTAGAGQDAAATPQAPAQQTAPGQQPLNPSQELAKEQPEGNALQVGPAELRIGGYLGLTGIHRSTNGGGGTGTDFESLPYPDTLEGNVSETRFSAQQSRISLRVDADVPEKPEAPTRRWPRFKKLAGYFEMDFSGATPGAVAVTSSSVGLRLRHAFGAVQYGDSFFLGAGQAFSLMTPSRDQLSIWPGDVEMSTAVDSNYLVGMIWTRSPQLRLAWRPSRRFNWAFSAENPEQQIDGSLVTLPGCCARDIEAQYNTGSNELSVPNLMPDLTTRVAFNPSRALHVDAGGVLRVFRHTVTPYDSTFKDVGGGASANLRVSATSSTKLMLQSAFGSGLGRYVGGIVPDAVFRRDGSISLLGTTSWVGGVEQKLGTNWSLGGYYSGVSVDRDYSTDADGAYIGYGFPGSPNSNNRKVTEITATLGLQVAVSETRGSVQLAVQTSWLSRTPWDRNGGPASADMFAFFAQLRYNLP